MRDELVRLHLKGPNLLAVGVLCTEAARHACRVHRCMPTAAGILSQAMAAGFGIAGLLGGQARINLQVTCDGPLKGLLVDADAAGKGRGYVNNPSVNFLAGAEAFEGSGALGSTGMLSVLREVKAGDFYRGSIALRHFELARDLERFYRESEQLETLVAMDVGLGSPGVDGGAEAADGLPRRVAAVFVQQMPGAAKGALAQARAALGNGFPEGHRSIELLRPLLARFKEDFDLQAEYPLEFRCACSMEKVLGAVLVLGRAEIEDMLATEGRALATCAFCNSVYEVGREQLQAMLQHVGRTTGARKPEEPN
jgi:molecular chaperone Hsp33